MWRWIILIIGLLFIAGAVAITIDYIKEEIRKRIVKKQLNALKGVILEAKKNSVKVGLFDDTNQQIGVEDISFSSKSDLKVRKGQEFYLQN
jgi:hypothetical protein